MSVIESISALFFQPSSGVDTDWDTLSVILALSESFHVLEISNRPRRELQYVSTARCSSRMTYVSTHDWASLERDLLETGLTTLGGCLFRHITDNS